jgi:integrase
MPRDNGNLKYLQAWKGTFRVRIRVPAEVRSLFDGREFLVKGLGIPVNRPKDAERAKHPVVSDFLRQIDAARATINGEDGERFYHPPMPMQPFTGGIKKYPPLTPKAEPVTFWAMIEKKYGTPRTETEITAKRDATTKLTRVSDWLGHDDMTKVQLPHGRDYRDSMVEEGELSDKSISNHLKAIKALFSFVAREYPEKLASDPLATLKFTPGDGEQVPPFPPGERKAIYADCRDGSAVGWFNLLGLFSGARNSELLRARKESIREIDGLWCIVIERKNGVKTRQSVRTIPLHSAILGALFLDYVGSLPNGAKLFPSLNGNCSKLLREFFDRLGIDKGFYSHGHFAITSLRARQDIDGDIKRYLTAHGKGDVHSGYGEYPMAALRAAIETIPVP